MNKLNKCVAVLLCATIILLSVFANAGVAVRAQSVEYLSTMTVKSVDKDSGGSTYTGVNAFHPITGKSSAEYTNGVAFSLTGNGEDGKRFVALTYDTPDKAVSFSGYVDIDRESENAADYSVKLEVIADGAAVYSRTLLPTAQYPVKLDVNISGSDTVTVKFQDDAKSSKGTTFVIGNAAMCEKGASIPAVTVPEQEESSEATDINTDVQQLLERSVKYMDHNYLLVTMRLSWEQAATWCEMQGGYLATIESEEENKFISEYLRSLGNKSAYFGLTSTATDGELKWQNGETAQYFNWSRQSVTDSGAKYMMISSGSDEWTLGAADDEYLNFVIEWGEKEVISEAENDSKDKAVIVIAGLGGSVLSDSDGDAAWAKKTGTYSELNLNAVLGEELTPAGSEYGVSDTYKAMIEGISEVCSDSDVLLYEWDWRYSGADAADGLKKLIEDGGWSSVSLVGHNTGGLVAMYYIGENETNNVTSLITLGTPFYGTEKAFAMIKTGMFAQGTVSVKGSLYDSVSELEALHSLIPQSPNVGTEGFSGKLTKLLSREDVLSCAGISRTDTDSALLKNVYKTIKNGDFGGVYVVAGTGTATVESISLDGDGEIAGMSVSANGDGLTELGSAAMNFESARPPYILEDTSANELVTSEDSIKLVCSILSGKADTSDYANGLSRTVYRSAQESDVKLTEISVSGSAKITVQTDGQTVSMSGSGYSFSGDPQCAVMYGDSVKTVFAADKAEVSIELLGSGVYFEMSGEDGTYTWSDIGLGTGAVLKTSVGSDVLTVTADPGNTGVTEIQADDVPAIEKAPEQEIEEETEEDDGGLVIGWNIWVAIGLVIAAAAVALILMPYFAYRVSKVETDRRKRALKHTLRQRRQQRNQQGTATSGVPALPSLPGDTVPVDISEVLSGDDTLDYEFLSKN